MITQADQGGEYVSEIVLEDVNASNASLANASNLLLAHLNIRSLYKHHEELCVLIENFNKRPDVFICTETWSSVGNFHQIPGYRLHHTSSSLSSADGVVAYVRDSLSYTAEEISIGTIKALELKLAGGGSKKLVITAIYRPHANNKLDFIDSLHAYLERRTTYDSHVVMGDINLDTIATSRESEEYKNTFCEFGFKSRINEITRPNLTGGTCLDHIYVKTGYTKTTAYLIQLEMTDHYSTAMSAELEPTLVNTNSRPKKSINFRKLSSLCSKIPWEEVAISADVNQNVDHLVAVLQNVLGKASQVTNRRNGRKTRSGWITRGLIKSCDTKKGLYKKLKSDLNNLLLRARLKAYSALLFKLLKRAKEIHDKQQLENCCSDSRGLWKFINSKLGVDQ